MKERIAVTTTEWARHAANCREVALTIQDQTARRILSEAADDYPNARSFPMPRR